MKFLRENGLSVVSEIGFNFVLPFAMYSLTQAKLGDVNALLASSIPPIVWSIIEFARKRRVDALSLIVLAGLALSLLAFAGGGSARFLQLRENLVTGVIGLAFLVSAAIGKPLIYQLARASMKRKSATDLRQFEQLQDNVYVRRSMMFMTVVWGVGLIVETVIACALVFTMPIGAYLIVSPIVGYGFMGALGLWTIWYVRHQRRMGASRRAAVSPPRVSAEP